LEHFKVNDPYYGTYKEIEIWGKAEYHFHIYHSYKTFKWNFHSNTASNHLSAFPFSFPPISSKYENIILWDAEHIFWKWNNTQTSLLNMPPVHSEKYWPICHSNLYMMHSSQVWLTFLKLSPAVPFTFSLSSLFCSSFVMISNLHRSSSWNVYRHISVRKNSLSRLTYKKFATFMFITEHPASLCASA
jgi:hypothetical protein